MRLATIRTDSGTRGALLGDGAARLLDFEDAGGALRAVAGGQPLERLQVVQEIELDESRLAPPVTHPEKIICVGLNYHAHAAEAKLAVPDYPLLFPKYSRTLVGPRDQIEIPPETEKCDWEAELAVVIGAPARRVSAADALGVVAGYTLMNDISMRNWQRHTSQMMAGKMFERSTPVGPWLVTPDEVDPRDVSLRCTVNGEVRQASSTSDMIFSVAEVIAYVSVIITLMPGDLIAMGTPPGVGAARRPPVFLSPGDVVVTEGEGLGFLRNTCVAERTAKMEVTHA